MMERTIKGATREEFREEVRVCTLLKAAKWDVKKLISSDLIIRRSQLMRDNENATGWGAAVSERREEIREIDRELERRGVLSIPEDLPSITTLGHQAAVEQVYDEENTVSLVEMPMETENDPVNHPKHYCSHPTGIECITIIEHFPANIAAAIKYLWRCGLKESADPDVDLAKAGWYSERERERRKAFNIE